MGSSGDDTTESACVIPAQEGPRRPTSQTVRERSVNPRAHADAVDPSYSSNSIASARATAGDLLCLLIAVGHRAPATALDPRYPSSPAARSTRAAIRSDRTPTSDGFARWFAGWMGRKG